MKKRFFAAALLAGMYAASAYAQFSVSGRVVDSKTGEPVQGATVRLRNTNIGCATDDEGKFLLRNIPDGHYMMRISRMDYATQSCPVDGDTDGMLIKMDEGAVTLNQVVVTGTGTHHRLKDSPVPVEVIGQEELRQANAGSVEDALQKLVPSISFQSTSHLFQCSVIF